MIDPKKPEQPIPKPNEIVSKESDVGTSDNDEDELVRYYPPEFY